MFLSCYDTVIGVERQERWLVEEGNVGGEGDRVTYHLLPDGSKIISRTADMLRVYDVATHKLSWQCHLEHDANVLEPRNAQQPTCIINSAQLGAHHMSIYDTNTGQKIGTDPVSFTVIDYAHDKRLLLNNPDNDKVRLDCVVGHEAIFSRPCDRDDRFMFLSNYILNVSKHIFIDIKSGSEVCQTGEGLANGNESYFVSLVPGGINVCNLRKMQELHTATEQLTIQQALFVNILYDKHDTKLDLGTPDNGALLVLFNSLPENVREAFKNSVLLPAAESHACVVAERQEGKAARRFAFLRGLTTWAQKHIILLLL